MVALLGLVNSDLQARNLALTGQASQSTTGWGEYAAKAIDGNLGSINHTADGDMNSWWQVDLGGTKTVESIVLYNRTDCCRERLTNVRVQLKDAAGNVVWFSDIPQNAALFDSKIYNLPNGARGQFVQIVRLGPSQWNDGFIHLREVQVWGSDYGTNLCRGGSATATQATTNYGGDAARAIDGNMDGNWGANSVTHTDDSQPAGTPQWWQVSFSSLQNNINRIVLWNRSDCCQDRLSNFRLSVFNGVTEVWGANVGSGSPAYLEFTPPNVSGDRVRVELIGGVNSTGGGALSLAEVQVYGGEAHPQPLVNGVKIGGDGEPGSLTVNGGGSYTIVGGGGDIWGNSDAFFYAYKQAGNYFDVQMRLDSFSGPDWWSKAGIMVRETTAADSRYVMWNIANPTGDNRFHVQWRDWTGGGTSAWDYGAPVYPNWMRLSRRGNVFYMYRSADGVIWSLWSRYDVGGWGSGPLPANVLVGVAVTSHQWGNSATAQISNYSMDESLEFKTIHFWKLGDAGGGEVGNLTGNWKYDPWIPDSVKGAGATEDPSPDNGNWENNDYGDKIWGVFQAWADGNYTFYGAGDDGVAFFLSNDEQPQGKQQRFLVGGWGNRYSWRVDSGPIYLRAGEKRYIEGLHKEGGGGNNFSLAVQGPGQGGATLMTPPLFVPSVQWGGYLAFTAGNVFVSQQPTNITVPANTLYSFYAKADGTPPWTFQWYKKRTNEVEFAAIPGATDWNTPLTAAQYPLDDQAQFYFVVTGPNNSATSDVATLTVTADLVPPTLLAAWTGVGYTNIYLLFSEVMRGAEANNPVNYNLSGGLTVESATLLPDGSNVVLVTSAQTPGATYTLTITNLWDVGLPNNNEMTPATTVTNVTAFQTALLAAGVVQRDVFLGIPNGNVLDLLNNPKWPNQPDVVDYISNPVGRYPTGASGDGTDAYGMRYAGHLIPSVSGNYYFEMQSDDNGWLYYSPDANASNMVKWPTETWCCGAISIGPFPLLAGQAYFFQALVKEGGGGDFLNLRWKPPGASSFSDIPSANLAYLYDVSFVTPPAPITVSELQNALFTATVVLGGAAQAPGKVRYQWERSDDLGANWTPIPGANSLDYTEIQPDCHDDQAQFRLVATVTGTGHSVTSSPATLTVTTDLTPPTLVRATTGWSNNWVLVTFSKAVGVGSADDPWNYSLKDDQNNEISIWSATITNLTNVLLVFEEPQKMTLGQHYTLTVNGVYDRSCNQNEIVPDSAIGVDLPTPGFLTLELYTGIGGDKLTNLTDHAKFINHTPDETGYVPSFGFGSSPVNINRSGGDLDNYGARIYGYFVPPSNGVYRFFINSDDESKLFFNSAGPDPAGAVQIAHAPSANLGYGNANAQSAAFNLVKGQHYFIEALVKEGAGGDYVRVAWREQGVAGTPPDTEIASGAHFAAYAPFGAYGVTIAQQPQNQAVPENTTAAFSVDASATPQPNLIAYQWQRSDGVGGFVDLPGASNNNLVTGPIRGCEPNDYRVLVRTPGLTVTSAVAQATVSTADVAPPTVVGASWRYHFTNVWLTFSEPVSPATANAAGNYSADNGLGIVAATLLADGTNVILHTTPQAPTANYTITVSGVQDMACTPNTIGANNTAAFQTWGLTMNYLVAEIYTNLTGSLSDFTSSAKYVNHQPDFTVSLPNFNWRTAIPYGGNGLENYGARIFGWFSPPADGSYRFYIRSDDGSQLFINPNGPEPWGRILVARENGCCKAYTNGDGGSMSGDLPMVAGQLYYVEALLKEGAVSDYVQVAFREAGDASHPASPNSAAYDTAEVAAGKYFRQIHNPAGQSINITQQPQSGTILEALNQFTNLTVAATANPAGSPIFCQWQTNDGLGNWVDTLPALPASALSTTFTYGYLTNCVTPVLKATTDYRVIVSALGVSATSDVATVTVIADVEPPKVVIVSPSFDQTNVTVSYSEIMDPATATSVGNYAIDNGLGILSATLLPGGRSVRLHTTPQTAGTTYTITINDVKDASVAGNVIAANTQATFGYPQSAVRGFLNLELFYGITGSLGDFTGSAKFINNQPDYRANIPSPAFGTEAGGLIYLNWSGGGMNDYGTRIRAFFVPPSNGVYRFYIRSDDASQLFINPNGTDPAGKVLVAREDGCCQAYGAGNSMSAGFPMTAGNLYYFEVLHKEGGGGDYVSVAWREAGDPSTPPSPGDWQNPQTAERAPGWSFAAFGDPAAQQVSITNNPSSTNLVEDRVNLPQAVLTVGATAAPQNIVGYQWQRSNDGGNHWADIVGAIAPTVAIPFDCLIDNAQFRAVVTSMGVLATSQVATVTVTGWDTTPPQIISVGSVDGKTIGVRFSEPVHASTALDNANYLITDLETAGNPTVDVDLTLAYLARTVNGAAQVKQDYLVLPLVGSLPGAFRVDATGQADQACALNQADSFGNGIALGLKPQDIGPDAGNPGTPGLSLSFTNNGLDLIAGGSDIWGQSDSMHMAWRTVQGDFDISVQVQSLVQADYWTKAGIMARASTNANSRMMTILTTPSGGANTYQMGWRDTDGGDVGGLWDIAELPKPSYPDVWLRLKREGSLFTSFCSTNGTDWILIGGHDSATNAGGAFPNALAVGLAGTSHNNNPGRTTLVEFRNLSMRLGPQIAQQPQGQTNLVGANIQLNVVVGAGNPPVLAMQWRKDGLPLPDQTNATLSLSNLQLADSGVYDVVLSNEVSVVISAPAVVLANRAPVAVDDFSGTLEATPVQIAVTKLITNDTDADGDALTVVSVGMASTGTVALLNNIVTYTPPAEFSGAATFTYTVSDGKFATAQATVTVHVRPGNSALNVVSGPTKANGLFSVGFAGIPGRGYVVERADAVHGPWTAVTTISAGTNGLFEFSEPVGDPEPLMRFYRTREATP